MTNALLEAATPAVDALIHYLLAAAQRQSPQESRAAKGSVPWFLKDAAFRAHTALAETAYADESMLRAHYDSPVTSSRSASDPADLPPPSATADPHSAPRRPQR